MSNEVQKVPSEYLDCRNLQHAWKPFDVTQWGRFYYEERICRRCSTTVTIKINKRTGALAGRTYTYPSDYQIKGLTMDAGTRGLLRLRGISERGVHIRDREDMK